MKRHLIHSDSTLLEALRRLNELSGSTMTLFVVDPEGRVVGTLTDGDVRRALLAGSGLDSPASAAARRDFRRLEAGRPDVRAMRECRLCGIRLLPVLRADGTLERIIDLNRTSTILPLSALLMAGGKGERLRPLTLTTPKPLLEIEGKAIIDYNIEALAACGVTDITVSVRYMADAMEAHFAVPVAGVEVRTVREDTPLGTIGAASLLQLSAGGDTLVMNSDLLTTVSFEDMFLCHDSERADITIAAIPYTVSVPYAILSADSNRRVAGIDEKPTYSYYANAGIYIFRNEVLAGVEPGMRTDATDFIERSIAEGRRVVYYPISGTWIDVGTPTDFRQASELMRHHRNMSLK